MSLQTCLVIIVNMSLCAAGHQTLYTSNSAATVFSLCTFYDCCNASRSVFTKYPHCNCNCNYCLCSVGQVVHTLPEGEDVWGVTLLADEVYVLRRKARDQVEVYDVINYRLQRRLTVPKIRLLNDMTSCEHYRCVYIGDCGDCIHRLDVQGAVTQWAVNDKPWGLSVNAAHNVLVTCRFVRRIKEFSSHGDLLRELTLPDDVINPSHAIQTRNGEFIVCHGRRNDAVYRVCKISAEGRHIIKSHGGQPGSDIGQYNMPAHLAVDNNEFVFVADRRNSRVTLLSPTLDYIRQVVSRDDLKGGPSRLCLDIHRRRLYVADNDWVSTTTGHVMVFRSGFSITT